jgi:hypothetical protein
MDMAAVTFSCTVLLLPTKQNLKYRRLVGHRGSVTCLSVSSNPICLASGSDDGTSRLWRIHRSDELCIFLELNNKPITSIALSPNADPGRTHRALGPGDEGGRADVRQRQRKSELHRARRGELVRDRIFDVRNRELVGRPAEMFFAVTAMSLVPPIGTRNASVFVINMRKGHIQSELVAQ